MDQQQEIKLVQSVAKLEERSKFERLSNQEMHVKMDLLITKIDDLKDYHNKDLEPLKVFVWLGKNNKVMCIIAILFLVSVAEKVPLVYEFILKKIGL